MSPDGRLLVYAASSGPGRLMLYRRALDRLSGEPIPGTEGAVQPFFSPDGRSLAFFTVGGELKKVALDGSPPVSLAKEMQNGRFAFGVWRDDNVIVFSAFQNLFQISADGGTPAPLTTLGEGADGGPVAPVPGRRALDRRHHIHRLHRQRRDASRHPQVGYEDTLHAC